MADQEFRTLGKRFFMSQDQAQGGPAREIVTDDYTLSLPGSPVMNWEGHDQFGKMFYAGFPDLHHTFGDPVVEGNRIVQPFVLNGTHTGEFMGIPPTGKPVRIEAIGIIVAEGDRVKHLSGVFDQLGMMRQLGVIP